MFAKNKKILFFSDEINFYISRINELLQNFKLFDEKEDIN